MAESTESGHTPDVTGDGPGRRNFLKAAAAAGVGAAVWAEPVIRAVPAYAQAGYSVISDAQSVCWSPNRDNWEGTMSMCVTADAVNYPGVNAEELNCYAPGMDGMYEEQSNVCCTEANYTFNPSGTLDQSVVVNVIGNPDINSSGGNTMDRNCAGPGSSTSPAIFTISTGGCNFFNVMLGSNGADGSLVVLYMGSTIGTIPSDTTVVGPADELQFVSENVMTEPVQFQLGCV